MSSRRKVVVVYAAGLIQGLALVTFPALHSVLTGASGYGVSNGQYGALFVPQAVLAIAASLLGGAARKQVASRAVYLIGLSANLLAMSLLLLSRCVIGDKPLAYIVLLGATASLGAGFGFTVPALNTFAAKLFPKQIDRAVLAMNALLGLGTALAPVAVAIFVRLDIWWALPLMVGVLLAMVLMISATMHLPTSSETERGTGGRSRKSLAPHFWLFAAMAFLYGICETMSGTWAVPLVSAAHGINTGAASIVLAVFWATLTMGRVLFGLVARWLPERITLRVLPFVVAAACAGSLLIPGHGIAMAIVVFAIAGLGCSALLPLTISTAQQKLIAMEGSVAGLLIACYQVGYGVAAFGVGALHSVAGIGLGVAYAGTAVVALAMAVLGVVIGRA